MTNPENPSIHTEPVPPVCDQRSTEKGVYAWAVRKSNGEIYVKTISDTRRAAIVNWLVTEKRVMVYSHHTDDEIEAMWKHRGAYVDCRIVHVRAAIAHQENLPRSESSPALQREALATDDFAALRMLARTHGPVERSRRWVAFLDAALSPARESDATALREAFELLCKSAELLFQNAVGCADNHHGLDIALNGLPPWLRDIRRDIDRARALKGERG